MITAQVSTFVDKNLHRWEQRFGIYDESLAVNYRTFGSGRRKLGLVGNTATNDANDVILL